MYYFYVLINEREELYFGSTSNLRRRFLEHNSNKSVSTRKHVWRLIYYEAYFAEKDARLREQKIKQFGQSAKHLKNRLKDSFKEISAG